MPSGHLVFQVVHRDFERPPGRRSIVDQHLWRRLSATNSFEGEKI
jgi:hypothetical protein